MTGIILLCRNDFLIILFPELLSCVRHLSIRSVITQVPIVETDCKEEEDIDGYDEHSCYDCKRKKQVALVDKLPSAVGLGNYYDWNFL